MWVLTDDNLGCGIAVAFQVLLQGAGCLHHVPVPDVTCDVFCIQLHHVTHAWLEMTQWQEVCYGKAQS